MLSRHMIMLGVDEISSFTDGTTRAGIAEALYPEIPGHGADYVPMDVQSAQSRFARDLPPLPSTSSIRHIRMPSDSLNGLPRAVYFSSGSGVAAQTDGWRLVGNDIQANSTVVTIDYQVRPLEAEMPTHILYNC